MAIQGSARARIKASTASNVQLAVRPGRGVGITIGDLSFTDAPAEQLLDAATATFETGTIGEWRSSIPTFYSVVASAEGARTGSVGMVLEVLPDGAGDLITDFTIHTAYDGIYDLGTPYPVTPEVEYEAEGWVKGVPVPGIPLSMILAVQFQDSVGTLGTISSVETNLNVGASWTRLHGSVIAPADAAAATLMVMGGQDQSPSEPLGLGRKFFFDDFKFTIPATHIPVSYDPDPEHVVT